jgi:hypothetical protein
MGLFRWLLGTRLSAGQRSTLRPPGAFETFGKLCDLPNGAIIGAGFAPGFISDLTCWRVWIYGEGRVRQEIRLSVPETMYRHENRIEEGYVAPGVAGGLVRAAEVAGFGQLAEKYESNATDQCTISVAIRLPHRVQSVVVYGAWDLCHRGHHEAMAALGLWLLVQRYAPWHPRREQGAPTR